MRALASFSIGGGSLGLGLCLLLGLAAPAGAHDLDFPIAGRKLLVDTRDEPQVRFLAQDRHPALDLRHDPGQQPSWLLLRGLGQGAGSTGRIELDATRWQSLGKGSRRTGYRYRDPEGTRGGVKSIVWKPGRLEIVAGGSHWSWSPEAGEAGVGVYFGIEDETLCAHFGGRVRNNESGLYRAYSAPAPLSCPEALCGNGVQELGEACDDGNLQDDDGCSRSCERTPCEGEVFASTFEAIQQRVFEDGGCTNGVCHGFEPGQGGLNLSADVAYRELVDVAATGTSHARVDPGAARDSALWIRLAKAADPGASPEAGTPMPVGAPPLSEELIEAVRLWVAAGAPETGTVAGTEEKLSACLPAVRPIAIRPLPAPDPEEGVQLVMPAYPLPAQSESENCFATYYDFRGQVPERYLDETGEQFKVELSVTRADPHTHHLIIMHAGLHGVSDEQVYDPSFGEWSCVGGSKEGQGCDPLDTASCREGICRSAVQTPSAACVGFGPPGGASGASTLGRIGGAGNGQAAIIPGDGYFRRLPLSGIVYWNSHAFNLTDLPHEMHARANLIFADDARFETELFQDASRIYIAWSQPPYTRESYCHEYEFEQGTTVVSLTSHTHQRGEAFWIEDPSGERIYESFVYSDPVNTVYDPPLVFDSEEPEGRTLTYCATYNNGVAPDGSPDPRTVRKRSVTPQNAFPCPPVACTEGRVGAPCDGVEDHASCDTTPGSGDGFCDACAISAGISTEDEMFVLLGAIIRP